jgi:hypothetical protein
VTIHRVAQFAGHAHGFPEQSVVEQQFPVILALSMRIRSSPVMGFL